MKDGQLLLDGEWEFLHIVEGYRTRPVVWRRIRVPNPWQAECEDLRTRAGTGLYRRKFEVPLGWKRERIFLVFGGVFHITRAWVNGREVGAHVGGFLPFSFDVTDVIVEGMNEIKVRVDAPSDDPADFPDTPFAEIPFRQAKLVRPAFRHLAVRDAGAAPGRSHFKGAADAASGGRAVGR
jgi:beta-galactosidase/beta-glucuronidase